MIWRVGNGDIDIFWYDNWADHHNLVDILNIYKNKALILIPKLRSLSLVLWTRIFPSLYRFSTII